MDRHLFAFDEFVVDPLKRTLLFDGQPVAIMPKALSTLLVLLERPGQIVVETLAAEVSERGATRMDDRTSDASMEKRKKDGYF